MLFVTASLKILHWVLIFRNIYLYFFKAEMQHNTMQNLCYSVCSHWFNSYDLDVNLINLSLTPLLHVMRKNLYSPQETQQTKKPNHWDVNKT